MNTNLTAAIAAERHQRFVTEATEYRRSRAARTARTARTVNAQPPARQRSHRVSAFLKDLAAASL